MVGGITAECKLSADELDELIQLYTQNDWPFHGSTKVKEGYLRNAWENADGTISDTLLYGAIKEDWQHKCITPSKMDELAF